MQECRTVLFSPEVVIWGDDAGGGSGGGRYGRGLAVVFPSQTRGVGSRLHVLVFIVAGGLVRGNGGADGVSVSLSAGIVK